MIRIGIDFGGTKIEAAGIYPNGRFAARMRKPNPGDYEAALKAVAALVEEMEASIRQRVEHVGVGMPGSVSPATGLIRGANSTWLNGQPFGRDLERALDRKVTLANDANCFALSEALPEHAEQVVFGAILGTGCGGAVVVRGQLVEGAGAMAGEWGHMPLPWPRLEENGARRCWCGRRDCMETWVSGPGFEADYARHGGQRLPAPRIVELARAGDEAAKGALDRYLDRLARGLAVICDIIDPDVIVLGGGMSNIAELYTEALTRPLAAHVFTDSFRTVVRAPRHGDSSGVRGAAWLVPA
jgi:fructokinase